MATWIAQASAGVTLPERSTPMGVSHPLYMPGTLIVPHFPRDSEQALFAMGCFWGAERYRTCVQHSVLELE